MEKYWKEMYNINSISEWCEDRFGGDWIKKVKRLAKEHK